MSQILNLESSKPPFPCPDKPEASILSKTRGGLADEAQATQAEVKYEQRVDSNGHSVLHHTASAQDANTGGKGPGNQNNVDGDAGNPVEAQGRHQRGEDQRE